MLITISDSFDSLENIVGTDLADWYKNNIGSFPSLISTLVHSGFAYQDVNYLFQESPEFNNLEYGKSGKSLYASGCGFFSVCQYYQLITGKNLSFNDIKLLSNTIEENKYCDTNGDRLISVGNLLGLDITEKVDSNVDSAIDALNNGKGVVFLNQGSTHFRLLTQVIKGENGEEDKYVVYDSINRDHLYQYWTKDEISSQMSSGSIFLINSYNSTIDSLRSNNYHNAINVEEESIETLDLV